MARVELNEANALEHISAADGENINAKRVGTYGYDSTTNPNQWRRLNVDADGKLNVNASASLAKDTLPVAGATEAVGVAIVDSSGNQISSFGGGTQYTEGDTDATITGTAVMVEDAGNTLAVVPGDNTKGMKVQITDGTGTQITSFGGGTQYTEGDTDASITGTAMMFENGGNTLRVPSFLSPLPVRDANVADHDDIFGRPTSTSPNNDIDIQFFRGTPSELLNVTTANSATATSNVGGALFSSSTNTNGSVQAFTTENVSYKAGSEIYAMFTASFTAGIADSYMRIGLYDANNGFFMGYEGTSFGITVRNNGSDVSVAKGSFSEDTLTGAATSRFTRGGTPEAIDLTKLNVFRIRFGWLGSAPCFWEVMSPDGHWVTFHKTLFPNLQANPSIRDADLPMTIDITKTAAAATDLQIQTDCWGAGTSSGTHEAQSDKIAFTTTTNLAGGATYSSGMLALSPKFSQVQTSVLASKAGTINIYWYSDAAGTDLVRTLTIPYGASDGFQMFSSIAFTPYVKYEYVNASGASQTDFYFSTKFLRRPLSPQILRVDGTIVGGMFGSLNRSIISGESSAGGGSYVNVKVNPSGTLEANVSQATAANLNATVVQGTATNLKTQAENYQGGTAVGAANPLEVSLANTGANATAVKVDGSATTISDGRKVVASAGTAEALATSTPCKRVDITAETDNTGTVVVGGSSVVATLATRTGTPLSAGDSYSIDISNLASIYIDATVNGDGVTYTYYN